MASKNKIANAYVQIIPTAEGITNSLEGVIDPQAENAGKSAGGKLGSGLLSTAAGMVAKGSAIAFGAATAATGALAKSAVASYGQYEQLVGGVDKLYKDASGKLQQYADQAYATSGMSANQYMESATSFSASLINSLGGDTQKAADLTDVAMRAMSDNVNVFGSNMGDVEHAFQGFAKQNYTMLDNLKLGYGGTKEEMQRLIQDANTYRESIGESSDLSIDSFADVVQAIQSVQEAQGIAGTTAKEAMSTIEGSATATKAAWENVITSIGRGEGISDAMSGLTEAIFGAGEGEGLLNQVLPRVQTVFEGIGTFVEQAAPFILEKVPGLISAVVPGLLSASASLFATIAQALPGLATGLLTTVKEVALSIGDTVMQTIPALLEQAPAFIDTGIQMVLSLVDGFLSGIPSILEGAGQMISGIVEYLMGDGASTLVSSAVSLIGGLVQALWDNLPTILTAAGSMISNIATTFVENLPTLAQGLVTAFTGAGSQAMTAFKSIDWPSVGKAAINFISNAARGAGNLISTALRTIGSLAMTAFRNINWASVGKAAISFISTAARGALGLATTALKTVGTMALNAFRSIDWRGLGRTVITFISTAFRGAMNLVVTALKNIGTNALNNFKSINWAGLGRTVITFIASAFRNAMSLAVNALKNVGNSAMSAFKNINWYSVGSAVISGIKNGITSTAKSIADAAKSAASKALSAAKGLLGIHSPSTVFRDQVGKMIGLGWAEGIEDTAGTLADSTKSASEQAMKSAQDAFKPLSLDGQVNIGTNVENADLSQLATVRGNLAVTDDRQDATDAVLNLLLMYLPQLAEKRNVYLDSDKLVGAIADPLDREFGYRMAISRG